MSNKLPRSGIIRKRNDIQMLFAQGQSLFSYPVKIIYRIVENQDASQLFQAGVSVSKKGFKSAVTRNLLKRRMREAIRLNQSALTGINTSHQIHFMMIYAGKIIEPYQRIEASIRFLMQKVSKSVPADKDYEH